MDISPSLGCDARPAVSFLTAEHCNWFAVWHSDSAWQSYSTLSPVSTRMGDHLQAGVPPQYVTKPTRSTHFCIPPGSQNRVTALIGWGKGWNVTSAGWQVTLCVIPYGTWVPISVRHVSNCYIWLPTATGLVVTSHCFEVGGQVDLSGWLCIKIVYTWISHPSLIAQCSISSLVQQALSQTPLSSMQALCVYYLPTLHGGGMRKLLKQ